MKLFLSFLMVLFSFTLFATNEITYVQKIENARTLKEKEIIYLEWVVKLSQENTFICDSIIKNKDQYISDFSDEGKIALVITHFNNSRLGGSTNIPNLKKYQLNKDDLLLVQGMIKCFKKEIISKEDYIKIKLSIDDSNDPTRKSLFYAISTCLEGTDRKSKINFFKSSIIYANKSPLKTISSFIYDIVSKFYIEIEDFEMAIQNQQKGISYSKKNKLTANTIRHLANIGHIHFELGDFEKAKEAFIEAEQLSKNLGLDYITGQVYNYLGQLYNSQKDLNTSIQYYQRSLIKFYNIDHTHGLASVHKHIGKTYYDKGDLDLAQRNYDLSLELHKEIENSGGKGELFYSMSQLHITKNQLNHAEFYILKAIECWETKRLLIPLNRAYLLYAQIKKQLGDLGNANIYLRKYIQFSDSIHKLETEKKVAELSELYKSEQKERKIAEQEKKLEEEKTERLLVQSKLAYTKQQNKLIIVILVISLVLFAAIFIIFRNRNKQEQLKKKQKEIELQQTLLRSQMNPHFIFNAMSVIQSYIYDEDIPNSSKFLIHFSKLMRLILENNAKEFITLDKEVEIINRYLVIQKMRFENRFDFIIENSKIMDHNKFSIPPMFVQPFIENAIEHGDLDKVENGLIRIHCEIVEDLFIFTIEDNGVGRKAANRKKKSVDSENHRSMAIELTQERIALLNEKHKGKGYLKIEDLDEKNETGTKVTIATPYKTNY